MSRYKHEQFIKDLEAGAYAFPGGYPRFFITHDGEALSFESAIKNQKQIAEAITSYDKNSGWLVIGCDINWEDQHLICAHSNKKIESAYGDLDKKS
jgi:hypothetical protein